MKHLLLIIVLATFSGFALAEEVETDCPMMAELNVRSNPKAQIANEGLEAPVIKSSSAQ